jgi:protein involved in sex pheromone biosynthesis
MRNIFLPSLVLAGAAIVFSLSGCASSNGSLQSRIERKVDNPDKDSVKITTAHYNAYAKDFESAWPFGPYSN